MQPSWTLTLVRIPLHLLVFEWRASFFMLTCAQTSICINFCDALYKSLRGAQPGDHGTFTNL